MSVLFQCSQSVWTVPCPTSYSEPKRRSISFTSLVPICSPSWSPLNPVPKCLPGLFIFLLPSSPVQCWTTVAFDLDTCSCLLPCLSSSIPARFGSFFKQLKEWTFCPNSPLLSSNHVMLLHKALHGLPMKLHEIKVASLYSEKVYVVCSLKLHHVYCSSLFPLL